MLATGDEEGKPQPLFWTREHGKGRVFVSIPGHFTWTFDDPLYRILLLRGIAWSAGESVDRFNELATIGRGWVIEGRGGASGRRGPAGAAAGRKINGGAWKGWRRRRQCGRLFP